MKTVGVCSVKGGTGKTSISINLALRLRKYGRVGFIDADIDNSSFNIFTKFDARIHVDLDRGIKPAIWNDIKVFSMSLLVGNRAVSMTEDRYVQIIADAAERGEWDVDFLVIDMPAGASDVFRGVIEIFEDTYVGDIIVFQPSMYDSAKRALYMHKVLGIPVLGIIENMAYLVCPKCGEKHYIFGEPAGKMLADEFGVDYFGQVPFIADFPERIAEGNPCFTDEEAAAVDRAVQKLLEARLPEKGWFSKLKEKVTQKLVGEIYSLIATLIVSINRDFDLGRLAQKYGFTKGKPFLLTITDEAKENIIVRVPLRLAGGRLKVIKNPKHLDFEVITDIRTFARMVMGKMRRGDRYVDYDPWDAWLLGDLKIYGRGHSLFAVKFFQEVFGDQETMKAVRERYGRILERWL